jgi:hypothetical protein
MRANQSSRKSVTIRNCGCGQSGKILFRVSQMSKIGRINKKLKNPLIYGGRKFAI